MSYFEDYDYSEPSELDELVDETTNKIKNMIIEGTKEKVDEILNKAEETQNRLNITTNHLIETDKENRSLKTENEKLKKELEQKRTSLDTLPLEIGEKVYYIRRLTYNEITCPLCKGTGKVTTHSDEYGDVEITCPHCKNNSYWSDNEKKIVSKTSYELLTVDNSYVKEIIVYLKLNDEGNIERNISVGLNHCSCYDRYDFEDIFTESQLEECKKECAERNKRYKEEAERRVGIIKPE